MPTRTPQILFWIALAGIVLLALWDGFALQPPSGERPPDGTSAPCNAAVCALRRSANG